MSTTSLQVDVISGKESDSVKKQNLLDFDREALVNYFTEMGEKPFRATQIMKWIYQFGVTDFSHMNNLSKSLRGQLEERAEVRNLEIASDKTSTDGTRKWLLRLPDGNLIESVFIPEDDRGTLCISSQVGCALDCSFCATGRQGFNRNLTTGEIISQLWLASKLLDEADESVQTSDQSFGDASKPSGKNISGATHSETQLSKKVTNVVMMGMGEPLLNFDNVVRAVRLMMDDFAYGLSKRRVTVSTAGVVPAMDRLSTIMDMRLAVSLHATNDELRNELVPLNKKYPIKELFAACRRFVDQQSARYRITFEYVMLDGVNDQPEHARELIKLVKGLPTLMNLIPFNPFEGSGYGTSSGNAVRRFSNILNEAGITTVVRKTRGEDIDAACGQLAGKIRDKSRRERRFVEPRFGMKE